MGNRPFQNKEQAADVIDFIRHQYTENGIGRWAVVDKPTGDFLGWSGLKFVKEPVNNQVNFHDLGYRLIRKYWGQGIATESALASLDYGFNTLGLKEIFAAAHVENKASNHILKKVGLKFTDTFDYDGEKHNWYEIQKR